MHRICYFSLFSNKSSHCLHENLYQNRSAAPKKLPFLQRQIRFQQNQPTETKVEFNFLSICAHKNQRTSPKSTETKKKKPTVQLCRQCTEKLRRKIRISGMKTRISSEHTETNRSTLQRSIQHCQENETNFAKRTKQMEKKFYNFKQTEPTVRKQISIFLTQRATSQSTKREESVQNSTLNQTVPIRKSNFRKRY